MPATDASTDRYVDLHHDLCRKLRTGLIADPEQALFLELIADPPPPLRDTPYLSAVSWGCGAYDLLFTDGQGAWCAVEVKEKPLISGSGHRRKNSKTTWKRRRDKLHAQVRDAWRAATEQMGGVVRAIGLWHDEGGWTVAAHIGDGPGR